MAVEDGAEAEAEEAAWAMENGEKRAMASGDENGKQQVMAIEYGRERTEALGDEAWERKGAAHMGPEEFLAWEDAVGSSSP